MGVEKKKWWIRITYGLQWKVSTRIPEKSPPKKKKSKIGEDGGNENRPIVSNHSDWILWLSIGATTTTKNIGGPTLDLLFMATRVNHWIGFSFSFSFTGKTEHTHTHKKEKIERERERESSLKTKHFFPSLAPMQIIVLTCPFKLNRHPILIKHARVVSFFFGARVANRRHSLFVDLEIPLGFFYFFFFWRDASNISTSVAVIRCAERASCRSFSFSSAHAERLWVGFVWFVCLFVFFSHFPFCFVRMTF